MKIERMASWEAFKLRIAERYVGYDLDTRMQFIFRGHASSHWRLQPTLDRLSGLSFTSDQERRDYLGFLIAEFRKNVYGLATPADLPEQDTDDPEEYAILWEFLGRHHGLPTTILDWTESPYVAAYFALEPLNDAEFASVWVLTRSLFDWKKIESVKLDSLEGAFQFNLRAAEQRGISMRLESADVSLEELLAPGLLRIDIPRAERQTALTDLDEMLINHRTLYRDLNAAARVAALRKGAE